MENGNAFRNANIRNRNTQWRYLQLRRERVRQIMKKKKNI